MSRVASVFVGCKVSQADGERALSELIAGGLTEARRHEEAEVVVVHTCCVTAEAERKSRRLARRYSGQGRRVIVAGCAARLRPEQFAEPGMEVASEPDWPSLARASMTRPPAASTAGGAPVPMPAAADVAVADDLHEARQGGAAGGRTRLVLKVQDGCAGSCSYCAVRLVRGEPRSLPLREALAAAEAGIREGRGELVLSGIDLGAWHEGTRRLPELVETLASLPRLRRLRLSSIEPRHIDDELLEALAHPLVARHLHLPLQSADDGVLADMCRPYTFGEYEAVTARVRERLSGNMLSTDVIVGFPTEDEAAFARTLAVLRSGLFGRVHVFAFSPRPGTPAAELPALPAAVVAARMKKALAAAAEAASATRRAAIGRPADVLVEDRRDGYWRGYSSEYVYYHLRGSAAPGSLVHVVAEHEHEDGVMGTLKESCP